MATIPAAEIGLTVRAVTRFLQHAEAGGETFWLKRPWPPGRFVLQAGDGWCLLVQHHAVPIADSFVEEFILNEAEMDADGIGVWWDPDRQRWVISAVKAVDDLADAPPGQQSAWDRATEQVVPIR